MPEVTREDVEKLKTDWVGDPIWDIELTEGFEAYSAELSAFADAQRAKWDAELDERERKHMEEIRKRAAALECSIGVMQYILLLENRVEKLQREVEELPDRLLQARRNPSSY